MKIAVIVRRLNVKGGLQKLALEFAHYLKQNNHDVTVYTFVSDLDQCFTELMRDLKIVSLETVNVWRVPFFSYINQLLLEAQLSKKLALQIDPHTEVLNPNGEAVFKVARYFKKRNRKIPSIWMMTDMVTKTASFERSSAVNSDLSISFFKKVLYKIFDTYEIKTFIPYIDAIAVLGSREKVWVKNFFNKNAHQLPGGLDSTEFIFRKRVHPQGRVKLLTTGIFFPHRRFEDIIEAVSTLRKERVDVVLDIIGDTNSDKVYYEKIKNMIGRLELNNAVHLLGKVSFQTLLDKYQTSSIFVFASHMQSWGLAVSEAQACGLPVIVSETSGASEVLTDRKNALIVPPKAPQAIVNAIRELTNDQKLYESLSEAGRAFVEKNISWDAYGKRMVEIINDFM
ncbi:glycosyltransferase family 4 protein [Candidatus Parcubacteria bacterium]|nr:glycosyltransferase family 4 protein [Candidatus Parcubacteria bacterium]